MVDDPPPAADTCPNLSKQRTPQCPPSCARVVQSIGIPSTILVQLRCALLRWNSNCVCAFVHRAKKVLRCELRSPLCTASNRLHAPSIKRSYEPGCKLQVASWELGVASYLCSTNVHCVDGEPICANDDPHSECTSCIAATETEYGLLNLLNSRIGGGWKIESKHVFSRESFFRTVITKAGTVATIFFFNTQIDITRGR